MSRLVLPRQRVFQGDLILVNAAHPLRESPVSRLAPPSEAFPQILMESRAAGLLAACIRAVGGTGRILPVSGWRSEAEQQAIWNDSLAEHGEAFTRSYVALPGCSEHQTGLAIDLGRAAERIDFLRPAFPYGGVCGAFRKLAADYGFVERYQKGKQALTGIAPEPWHFRYLGAPHATLMVRRDLCLEEYLELLRAGPQSCVLAGGRAARVFYVPCAGEKTELELPSGCCQVSGDNLDGFIVTVWGE